MTTMRGSGEAAGPPPSVQSAVEEKSSDGLGEESERKTERRVRGERDRRGWAVRGFMVHATKRCGLLRSFPRRAGEASRCALQSVAPWKRSIRRYPQGLCGGCFNARAGLKNEGALESNQRPLGSPGPGSTLRRLPNVPLAYVCGRAQLQAQVATNVVGAYAPSDRVNPRRPRQNYYAIMRDWCGSIHVVILLHA
jgi:hypothetical protein